ncbi:formamidopyrimidine-DNA glycosylase [Gottschalkiaceae bacterium SANA]|nr:formamidopyrimidine-DNA glycosylase [Gottschalkiaceae bacterium SANA]
MIELPEAMVLAKQCNQFIVGKVIEEIRVNQSPHKLAWFVGDPEDYIKKLTGKTIEKASAIAGFIELKIEDVRLAFSDGVQLLYTQEGKQIPKKHQLMIRFTDQSVFTAKVQMYGGIWCFQPDEWENKYYEIAKVKPSPLTESFSEAYFKQLMSSEKMMKLSAKAFLATEQRIPGLGNGILQDILFAAGIHPKRKLYTFSESEKSILYSELIAVIKMMVEQNGRDTEKDLFGNPGGYGTKMSRKTVGKPCPKCGEPIQKQAYMGGSVYACPNCQIE